MNTHLGFSIRIQLGESSRENSDHDSDEQGICKTSKNKENHRAEVRMEAGFEDLARRVK
jgi:hypothetical protein